MDSLSKSHFFFLNSTTSSKQSKSQNPFRWDEIFCWQGDKGTKKIMGGKSRRRLEKWCIRKQSIGVKACLWREEGRTAGPVPIQSEVFII